MPSAPVWGRVTVVCNHDYPSRAPPKYLCSLQGGSGQCPWHSIQPLVVCTAQSQQRRPVGLLAARKGTAGFSVFARSRCRLPSSVFCFDCRHRRRFALPISCPVMTFMAHTITTVVLFLTISFCASSPVEDHSTSSATLSSSDYVSSPETTSTRRAEGEIHDLWGGSSSAPPRSHGDVIDRPRRRTFDRKELERDFNALRIDSIWEPKNILKAAVKIFAKQENNSAATKCFTQLLYEAGVPAEKVKVFQLMRSRERWNNHFRSKQNVPCKNAVARSSTKNSNLQKTTPVRKRLNRSKVFEEARDAELKEFEDKLSAAYSQYGTPGEAEASVRQEYSRQHYSSLQVQRKRKTQLEGPSRLADKAPSSPSAPSPARPLRSPHSMRFGASVDKPAEVSPKPPTKLQVWPGQVSKKQFRGHQLPGTSRHGARVRSEDGKEQSYALQKSTPSQSERPTVGQKRYRAAEGQTPNSQVSRGQVATMTVAGYKRPLPVHAGP